ncbi:ExbD/TolR family protein [Cohaesibacter marisflavi]|uniref:ExbD/TolR family protein n=1 Tax=Cohaesibacter marisflavi TaxID=655353 RepID=UPI0029C64ABC|nr:biopolymer transporter ExbD [Cohaesibacter marisflavi]
MRMHKAKAHKKVLPDNTIPLINIVFLMLIFFLIAGTVAPPVSSELTPPNASKLEQMPPAGNAVEILADGTLIHHGRELSLKEMLALFPAADALQPAKASSASGVAPTSPQSNEILHILADKALPAKKLMTVLQAFRAAGHRKIRLVTLREGD